MARGSTEIAYWPRLLREDQAAAYVGCGPTKFRELVDEKGIMPKPLYPDVGMPRWDRVELDAAVDDLKECRRDPVRCDRDRLEERIRQMEKHSS
jgi:hypothetical protein